MTHWGMIRLSSRPSKRLLSRLSVVSTRSSSSRRMATTLSSDETAKDQYASLSPDELLLRVRSLEKQLKDANEKLQKVKTAAKLPVSPSLRSPGKYDASRYSTRLIALKFAYLGQNYHGFEHHRNNPTPTPTIEELLWRALVKTRLVWPASGDVNDVDWTGMDYSKCGRTDKGVSAFGQVIGIRVRSNQPLPDRPVTPMQLDSEAVASTDGAAVTNAAPGQDDVVLDVPMEHASDDIFSTLVNGFDDVRDELPYISMLNRVLPPEVRILAWCPSPPEDFSARFNCQERRYRYFFTQPAFSPPPGNSGFQMSASKNGSGSPRRGGWLDIEAMQKAAKKYEGLHDFRNFCKIDPSKQIENFHRRMFVSEVRELDPASEPAAYVAGKGFSETDSYAVDFSDGSGRFNQPAPKVYQFVLHGSAFLWHQVRHMVAILFLIGQGLESPSLIDELLDTKSNPRKPVYEMADDAPLVLWDCIFPEERAADPHKDGLPWIWIGDPISGSKMEKFGRTGVVDEVWSMWRKHKMDELLAGSLLNLAVNAGGTSEGVHNVQSLTKSGNPTQWIYQGGVTAHPKGSYVPVMKRKTAESPEVVNERYRLRKGLTRPPPKDDRNE